MGRFEFYLRVAVSLMLIFTAFTIAVLIAQALGATK